MAAMNNQERKYPTRDQIEQRAYEIYLQEGGADGRAEEHWLRAESELLGESGITRPTGVTPTPLTEKSPLASRAAKR
jgi:hypothetical protein